MVCELGGVAVHGAKVRMRGGLGDIVGSGEGILRRNSGSRGG